MTNTTLKTRVTPRAEDTRRKIYDAAMALFREKGFDETTMRENCGQGWRGPGRCLLLLLI